MYECSSFSSASVSVTASAYVVFDISRCRKRVRLVRCIVFLVEMK